MAGYSLGRICAISTRETTFVTSGLPSLQARSLLKSSLSNLFCPSLKRFHSKRKEFKFFTFRVEPFVVGGKIILIESSPLKECLFPYFRGMIFMCTLRRHAYSNILKILPPKNKNLQIEILTFLFHFCSKTWIVGTR